MEENEDLPNHCNESSLVLASDSALKQTSTKRKKNRNKPAWDKVITKQLCDYSPALTVKSPKKQIVVWQHPVSPWIKVNTDGLSKGNPGPSACGGVFRADSGKFLGGFSVSLGTGDHYAFVAELMAVFHAINIAHSKRWLQLWLESDCLPVVRALKSRQLDHPEVENLWKNCLNQMESMIISFSHIYREGNRVADMLANIGLGCSHLQWWDDPPKEIRDLLLHDSQGLPYYRVF